MNQTQIKSIISALALELEDIELMIIGESSVILIMRDIIYRVGVLMKMMKKKVIVDIVLIYLLGN